MGGTLFNSLPVCVKKLHVDAQLPVYATAEAAGADLFYIGPAVGNSMVLPAGERAVFKTGIAIELSPGFEAQVRSRSGLAAKFGIMVLNSPGTIDSDYRGELMVTLLNTSAVDYVVRTGDRIAQMIIAPVVRGGFFETLDELSTTARGEGGIGSTGFGAAVAA